MSFTLPVPYGEEAEECAKQYVKKIGFEEPNVTYYCELTPGYTFFVCIRISSADDRLYGDQGS